MHIHNVAEGTIAAPSKVEAYTALPYLQISDMQLIEKIGQHRINDVQFFPVSTRTNSQDRSQQQEERSRGPRLRRTRNRIVYRLIMLAPLHTAEELRQPIIAEVERSLIK